MSRARYSATKLGRLLLTLLAALLTALLIWRLFHSLSRGDPISLNTAPQPLETNRSLFAIISMTTAETTYDYISFSNKHKYAAKHGYRLIWDFEPRTRYLKVWDKLNLTRDAITASLAGEQSSEWIWMLDYDTLVTNTSVQLSHVVDQSLAFAVDEGKSRGDIDLLLTRDCEPLNLGSLFLRASPWALAFIEQWRMGAEIPDDQGKLRNEQDVLRDMLAANEFSTSDKSVIVPQSMFDAYPEELACYDPRFERPWEPGMFLLHFAGARWRLEDQKDPIGMLMRQYYDLVI